MINKRFSVLALLLFTPLCMANPIVVSGESHGVLYSLVGDSELNILSAIMVTLVALALELGLLLLCQKHFGVQGKRLLIVFPLIHLITFPVTQYLSFSLGYAAEVFPIVVETLVYKFTGVFSKKSWRNLCIVAVANVLSWLVGHVYLWYIWVWSV